MKEIFEMTALELSSALKNKQLSVRQTVLAFLDRAKKYNSILNCFNCIDTDKVLSRADEVQAGIDSGKYKGKLAGVPFAVKDNICTKDLPTTCSSKMLENFVSPYNATVINRLSDEGLIILGKTNMDEFSMGSTTETSYFKAVKNPWDTDRIPGGSSGGSAVCVSAGLAPAALGTDTGGSIRLPCSFCSVSGLKPTYGAVSRYGLIAYASSFDQIGPIARNIDDCAAFYSIICSKDKRDSSSNEVLFDFDKAVNSDIKGKKIGIPEQFVTQNTDEDIRNAVLNAAEVFKSVGAEVELFSMPSLKYAVAAYYIIACAEASSNLARYDGIKFGFRAENCNTLEGLYVKSRSEGFGTEVKRRILLGNFVLSTGYYDEYYKKALQAKALIERDFSEIFKKYNIILSPVSPAPASRQGEALVKPSEMYLGDCFTVPVNLAGLPAVSCPCGFDRENMPIGMQLIGNFFCEEEIISAAKVFQSVTDFHKKSPDLNFGGKEL